MLFNTAKLSFMDIKEIAKRAGMGVVELSIGMGMSRAAASQWDEVPHDRVLPLCEFVGWKVTPHEVRPDLYPNPADALPDQYRCACPMVSRA